MVNIFPLLICRAGARDFNLGATKSKIGALLVSKFSREIHFSIKLFKSSLQDMSWKLPGATNFSLQKNLIFSRVAKRYFKDFL